MPNRPRKARTASVRNAGARKSTNLFSLLDLPPELIDAILYDMLHLPYHLTRQGPESLDIADILALPILLTCKSIRQRALQLIKNGCMWIRIGYHSAEELIGIRKRLVGSARTVPCGWRSFFDDKIPIVDILLGSDALTATGDRILASPEKSVLLPFSYDVWLQIFTNIQEARSPWPVKYHFRETLTFRCYPWQSSMTGFSRKFILPPFLMLRRMRAVGFDGDALDNFQRIYKPMMVGKHDISAECQDLITILKQIASFDSKNETVFACLLALYSSHKTQIKCDLSGFQFPTNSQEYLIHNSIARCWYVMERKRFAAYFDYRYLLKLQWPKNIVSWLTTPMCWWKHTVYRRGIFLRCLERARLHQMMAVVMITEARLEAGLKLFGSDMNALHRDEEYTRDRSNAAEHSQISHRLFQKMGVSDTGSDIQKIIDKEQRIDPPEDQYVEFHNVRGTGYYWAGHKAMLNSWSEDAFNHLPLAVGRPEIFMNDDDLRVFAGELSHETVYCGEPCHCIVF